MTQAEDVACIVLNWRNSPATASCIKTVLEGSLVPNIFYVVDNHSGDDACTEIRRRVEIESPNALESRGCRVIWIETLANIGYAAANNLAIIEATKSPEIKYLWILNNDTAVSSSALSVLRGKAELDSTLGFVGGIVRNKSSGEIYCHGGGGVLERLGLAWRNKRPPASKSWNSLKYVMGCNMLIRAEAIEQCGLMDESYFMYSEEVDWQIRARNFGWKIGYSPDCIVLRSGDEMTDSYHYYRNRSSVQLSKKHGGYLWALLSFTLHLSLVVFRKPTVRTVKLGFAGCIDGIRGVTGRSLKC